VFFRYPNQITQQISTAVPERGLYFMSKWDRHFVPLLASHDPEKKPPLKGGLLGSLRKGTYIYSGYAFFFGKLAGGRAGSNRLYVNMLSRSHASTLVLVLFEPWSRVPPS